MSSIKKFLKKPRILIPYLADKGLLRWLGDKAYVKLVYWGSIGRRLDLKNPKRFTEKMQYLKFHEVDERYTDLADKVRVKEYISKLLGEKYVIKTLGGWDRPEDIDFDKLPDKFVLKCNHNSGRGMYICKDKSELDRNKVISGLKKGLKQDYYLVGRERQYKNIKRKILAEEFMEDEGSEDLKDYKVFVFNGRVRCIQVDLDRFTNHRRNFYDPQWNCLPFTTLYPSAPDVEVRRPECLEEMLDASEKISSDLNNPTFLRMDFYVINGKLYFGEITIHHGSGFEPFIPDKWDEVLGGWMC